MNLWAYSPLQSKLELGFQLHCIMNQQERILVFYVIRILKWNVRIEKLLYNLILYKLYITVPCIGPPKATENETNHYILIQ